VNRRRELSQEASAAVGAGWIGIVAFCMGGRIVYLMSAVNADFVKFV
jgi:dienelactone hydrolase